MQQYSPSELIILSGGLGSRLREVVTDVPKILAPVADKTFLDFLLQEKRIQGFTRFVFSTGHLGDKVESYMRTHYPFVNAIFIREDSALGTGGAITNALASCQTNTIAVVNGDTLFQYDLERFCADHLANGACCTILATPVAEAQRYGTIECTENGRVVRFIEKGKAGFGMINSGTYLINKTKFLRDRQLPEVFSLENDLFPVLTASGELYMSLQTGYFLDIGVPEDLLKAQTELPLHAKGSNA